MDLQEEVKKNPLCTRSDCVDLLLALCEPLKKHFSSGCARLLAGWTGAHYGEKAAEMEGFARILWGMGPFFFRWNRRTDRAAGGRVSFLEQTDESGNLPWNKSVT